MASDNLKKLLPRKQAYQKLGISTDAFIVGTISNLYRNKGLSYLLNAANKIIDKNVKIIIVGNDKGLSELESEKKKLDNIIKKNNLKNKIILTGYISNAAELLNAFDIYVCSSTKEGMPYSILEAMQAGLPIVSTNVGAISGILDDNKNGLLVEPKNVDELAKKINYLIKNPSEMKRLGDNAKEKVKQFSLNKMITETEKLY